MLRSAAILAGFVLLLGAASAALGDERLAVPASRFSLEVPEAFSVGQGFPGYEDIATKSRIVFIEFPPGLAASNYEDFKPLFDDLFVANSAFADQGIIFDRKETITTRDGKSLPVIAGIGLRDGQAFERWMMLSGPEGVAVVLFTMLEGSVLPDETVRTILSSLDVAPALSLAEQLAELPFGLTTADPLSTIDIISGAALALTQESFARHTSGDPLVVLGWQISGTAATTDPVVLAEQLLRSSKVMTAAVIEQRGVAMFAGVDGYRIEGSVDFKGTPSRFVQYTALVDGRHVQLMATVPTERADELFPIFELIAGSVRQQEQ